MIKNYLAVRLSNQNDPTDVFDLTFKFKNHPFVARWQKQFLISQQRQDPISEPWAIYGNNFWTDQKIVEHINHWMEKCNAIHPGLFDCKLTDRNDQDKLNYIHSIFEKHHGKLDEWISKPMFQGPKGYELRDALSKVNQAVHRVESTSLKIRVVYFDTPKTELFDSQDYQLFTTSKQFGGLYTLYADVGKNLDSLAEDEDDHHHDFVPSLHFSSDFVVRFVDDTGESLDRSVETYLNNNMDVIKSAGYQKGDIRLTPGSIHLADLLYSDRDAIVDKVKMYDNIQSVFLFDGKDII
tara:strand:- start:386 stop:1270 length:885 start_codon:yes stop_codon:yes gene_type:complete